MQQVCKNFHLEYTDADAANVFGTDGTCPFRFEVFQGGLDDALDPLGDVGAGGFLGPGDNLAVLEDDRVTVGPADVHADEHGDGWFGILPWHSYNNRSEKNCFLSIDRLFGKSTCTTLVRMIT